MLVDILGVWTRFGKQKADGRLVPDLEQRQRCVERHTEVNSREESRCPPAAPVQAKDFEAPGYLSQDKQPPSTFPQRETLTHGMEDIRSDTYVDIHKHKLFLFNSLKYIWEFKEPSQTFLLLSPPRNLFRFFLPNHSLPNQIKF